MIMDPYEVLGVSPQADDDAVRKAYLELVRQCSPDRDPEAFKRISSAYELVKTEKLRMERYLFNRDAAGETPLGVFLRHERYGEKRKPLEFEQMKAYLRKCAKK
jgi:curved DNA-binding protein CbpA